MAKVEEDEDLLDAVVAVAAEMIDVAVASEDTTIVAVLGHPVIEATAIEVVDLRAVDTVVTVAEIAIKTEEATADTTTMTVDRPGMSIAPEPGLRTAEATIVEVDLRVITVVAAVATVGTMGVEAALGPDLHLLAAATAPAVLHEVAAATMIEIA